MTIFPVTELDHEDSGPLNGFIKTTNKLKFQ